MTHSENEFDRAALELVEQHLFSMADELPIVRPSLRTEVLCDLALLEHRRRQFRCVPLVAVFFVLLGTSLWGAQLGTKFIELTRSPVGPKTVPVAITIDTSTESARKLAAALAHSDSWVLVDAYTARRDRGLQGSSQRQH